MLQIISKHQALSFDVLVVMDTKTGILAAFGLHCTKLLPETFSNVEADINLSVK